jgi:hypothetical protein
VYACSHRFQLRSSPYIRGSNLFKRCECRESLRERRVRAVGLGAAHRLYQGGHCLTKWRTLGIFEFDSDGSRAML